MNFLRLRVIMLFLSLTFVKGIFANSTDTTINCLIFFNDKILYPRECQNFILSDNISNNSILVDSVSLTFNIGTITFNASDYKKMYPGVNSKVRFEYFYTSKENCCLKKIIELEKIQFLFEKHKYLIIRIYDMELKKYKRKFHNPFQKKVLFSFETETTGQVISTL